METQFYWGMFTMLAVQGLGYFIWTRIQAAKRRKESREAYIPPSGSGFDHLRKK